MVKVARDNGTLLVIPNAGANAATGSQCAPNIFRTSFSNWQPAHPMGKVMYDKGHRKVVTLTWKYGAGEESVESFKEAFTKLGGSIVKEMFLPFPNVEFQPFLTEIGSLKPDAVFVFFAGGGAAKFTKDYMAAGLKDKIPLYGTGFLTDGTLEAQGASAQGLLTTLHYGDGIENPKNKQFRYAYGKKYGVQADVYAVQGYDAGLLLPAGSPRSKAASATRTRCTRALEKVKIDSPRGPWVDVQGAQSDPGHLSAPGRGQRQSGDRRRVESARRSRARLQDGGRVARPHATLRGARPASFRHVAGSNRTRDGRSPWNG